MGFLDYYFIPQAIKQQSFFLLPVNFFPVNFLSVIQFFLIHEFFPVTGNFFLWWPISSCERNFFPETGIVFMWQEISSCDRKFFLQYKKISCYKKFLTAKGNIFITVHFFRQLFFSSCFHSSRTQLTFSWQSAETFEKISCEAPSGIQDPRFPVKIRPCLEVKFPFCA